MNEVADHANRHLSDICKLGSHLGKYAVKSS